MNPKRKARMERAVIRHQKTISSHEKSLEFIKQIIEDHRESTSQKYMKFDSNLSDDQIEKMRSKKLERAKTVLENTKVNLRG